MSPNWERKSGAPAGSSLVLTLFMFWCAVAHGQTNITITQQPLSQTVSLGSHFTLTVGASGMGPFNFQWRLNGNNLPLNGIINTIAGGMSGPLGDGGPATNATLVSPDDVTADRFGNIFVSETMPSQIRKVDTNGIITTFAGNGMQSYSGDGGPATNAALDWPINMATDRFGNFFVADSLNHRVRKVDTNGIITTFAGSGAPSDIGDHGFATNAGLNTPHGVAVDAAGNLLIADTGNGLIRMVDSNGIITTVAGGGSNALTANASALDVALNAPVDVAADNFGNYYIDDAGASVVCKVGTDGLINPVAALNLYPFGGIAADPNGDLFIPDVYGSRVWELPASSDTLIDVAGNGVNGFFGDGGPATNSNMTAPLGVMVDGRGDLYVVDSNVGRVREVFNPGPILSISNASAENAGNYDVVITSLHGSITSSVAVLTVTAPPAIIVQPRNQSAPAGTEATFSADAVGSPPLHYQWYFNNSALFAANTNTFTLTANTSSAGTFTLVVSNRYGSTTSVGATLAVPVITMQPQNQNVLVGNNATFTVATVGGAPYHYQWFFNNFPLSGQTNIALVLDDAATSNAGSYKVLVNNRYADIFSEAATLTVGLPPTIVTQSQGETNILGGALALRVAASGTGPLTYQWSLNGTNIPTGIVTVFAGTGGAGYSGDGGYATNAEFYGASNVVVDCFGNVIISDDWNFRVRRVAPSGIITTIAGDGTTNGVSPSGDGGYATNAVLVLPDALAIASNGDLYVSQNRGSMFYPALPNALPIRKINADGIITTFAGGGTNAIAEGIMATNAGFGRQLGLAVDNTGDLLIADIGYNRVRKVTPDGIINTIAGTGRIGFSGDGGPATNAEFSEPFWVASDGAGNTYVADAGNNRIREIKTNGIIETVLGGGKGSPNIGTNAYLRGPVIVALGPYDAMYVVDTQSNYAASVLVELFPTNGPGSVIVGGGTSNPQNGDNATNVLFRGISGLAIDKYGSLYFSDGWSGSQVFKVPITGPTLDLAQVPGSKSGVYQVVITGPYGSVTSAPMPVTIILPPQNLSAKVTQGSGVQLSFNGTPGYSYVLQAATNLASPINWQPVFTNVADAGGNCSFTQTNAFIESGLFYRAALMPP